MASKRKPARHCHMTWTSRAIGIARCSRSERKMPRKSNVQITPSTGNVFRDLGFSPEEAQHLLIRADLLIQLQKTIASRGLTQTKAAKILRVTQPRISDLLRGRIELFSTDSLIDMLARLGVEVRLVLKSGRRRRVA